MTDRLTAAILLLIIALCVGALTLSYL